MFASPDRPARTRGALAMAIAALACTDYGVSTGVVVGEPPVANFDAGAIQSASTLLIDLCRDTDRAGFRLWKEVTASCSACQASCNTACGNDLCSLLYPA